MDPIILKWIIGIMFVLTYLFIILFYQRKAYIVWATTIFFMLLGVIGFVEGFKVVNWNVIGIYVGMLFVSEIFIYSRVPDFIAVYVTNKSKYTWVALVAICFISGLLSMFLENVAVVLIVAPIAFSIAKRLKVSPVGMMIGIAISSNLQGTATLIGDPPSMILAGFAKLTFNDFIFFNGKPGIFWCVQAGAIASLAVLYFVFRKFKAPVKKVGGVKIRSFAPAAVLVLMVILLALSSFFDSGFSYMAGIICVVFGAISLVWYMYQNKKEAWEKTKAMDWETAFFLMAIFILVEALVKVGLITDIAKGILSITGTNVFIAFNLVVWISVALSAFIDNVPYIVAMLPVVDQIAVTIAPEAAAVRYLFLFGLVLGASVGGNITPVGASANVVAVGMLKNRGYKTTFWEFVKIGLPFTLVSVMVAEIVLWVFYAMI